MPRLPKNPATRQRRNRAATRATLPSEEERAHVRIPPLPKKGAAGRTWHELTRAWWNDIWRSPMAAKWLRADWHGLYRLAAMVDRFWFSPDPKAHGEIRLHEQRYGLTPLDRWRLQWELRDPAEKADAAQPAPAAPVQSGPDPRSRLRRVK